MDQKRLILAGVLSLAILLAWGLLFPAPKRPAARPPAVSETPVELKKPKEAEKATPEVAEGGVEAPAGEEEAPAPESIAAASEEEVVLEVEGARVRFTNRGAQIVSYELGGTHEHDGSPLEIVRKRAHGPYPFALVDADANPLAIDDALFVVERGAPGGQPEVTFRYSGAEGTATKSFRFREDGLFEVSIEAHGLGAWGVLQGPGLRNPSAKELGSRYQVRAATHSTAGQPRQFGATRLKQREVVPADSVSWFALEDTYFVAMLAPITPVSEVHLDPVLVVAPGDAGTEFVERPPEDQISEAQEDLPQELEMTLFPEGDAFSAVGYWGPKSYAKLAALPYDLEKTVRFNYRIPVLGPVVGFLARYMLVLLLWIDDKIVPNLGWSIVLLTVSIKLALLPLTHKSYVSMQKMQKLNPKIEAIKQKYRGKQRDKQGRPNLESQRKMNEEMQELFRAEGVNPAGGCLPMLLQMPVFFAFFSLLRNSVELWNAPWGFWIHDLSAPDPYYVLPVIMGAAQFFQQRLTPTANTNPGQKILLTTMPFWFTFISFGFASGLVLYWLTNNLMTIAQQTGYQQLKKAGYFGGEDVPTGPAPQAGKKKERRGRSKPS